MKNFSHEKRLNYNKMKTYTYFNKQVYKIIYQQCIKRNLGRGA